MKTPAQLSPRGHRWVLRLETIVKMWGFMDGDSTSDISTSNTDVACLSFVRDIFNLFCEQIRKMKLPIQTFIIQCFYNHPSSPSSLLTERRFYNMDKLIKITTLAMQKASIHSCYLLFLSRLFKSIIVQQSSKIENIIIVLIW